MLLGAAPLQIDQLHGGLSWGFSIMFLFYFLKDLLRVIYPTSRQCLDHTCITSSSRYRYSTVFDEQVRAQTPRCARINT